MPFDAPATNRTLPLYKVEQIETRARNLESAPTKNLASDQNIPGAWRLLYTNAREITNIAQGLPLGFVLGKTYQPIDAKTGRFENQGRIEHIYGLARAKTRVVGAYAPAAANTINAAGIVNDSNNRINVNFERLTFELDDFLGVPCSLRKVIAPQPDPEAPQTAIDVTYIDDTVRITRGGDGALFVLIREDSEVPMLTDEEFQGLLSVRGASRVVNGRADADAPPEFRRLVRQR